MLLADQANRWATHESNGEIKKTIYKCVCEWVSEWARGSGTLFTSQWKNVSRQKGIINGEQATVRNDNKNRIIAILRTNDQLDRLTCDETCLAIGGWRPDIGQLDTCNWNRNINETRIACWWTYILMKFPHKSSFCNEIERKRVQIRFKILREGIKRRFFSFYLGNLLALFCFRNLHKTSLVPISPYSRVPLCTWCAL